MLHAVIMAGGTGTRFWPESRLRQPKQLLRIIGRQTMIRATVDRLGDLVPPQRLLVATTARLAGQIAEELSELPREAILAEPCRRNTAPCIGLAAIRVSRDDPQATLAVMPADHVIGPAEVFRDAIRFAASLVEQQPERLITFGIRPSYPAESFGYIERGERLEGELPASRQPAPAAYRLRQFREKPSAEVAREYLRAGTFYWNSGIFLWKARTILDALAHYQPQMCRRLGRIADAADTPRFDEVLRREFSAVESISIDYAVMEHASNVVMVEAPFRWDDVGSWQAVARLQGTDAEGNTIAAKHLGLNTSGTIVRGSDDHLIVTVGLEDCIIVHTPDATLVANRHDEESIRRVVELIEERGWKEYL
jgi:mannose-1-phosphate guanylyltransferase